MKYILALDIGTTSTRAIVFDDKFRILGKHSLKTVTMADENGQVEQDPMELWDKTLACAKEAIKISRIKASSLACIGITNQRESVLAWDSKTGKCLSNALIWQDKRTALRCKQLADKRDFAHQIQATTGLIVDPVFSASKMEWLNQRLSKNPNLILGTIDAWMLWKLTNGQTFATEPSNASRTMLMDLKTCEWDLGLLKEFHVRREQLPTIMDSNADFGKTDMKLFGVAIPITGILGDQQAALFAQGKLSENNLAVTYGTGIFALKTLGSSPKIGARGLLTTVAWRMRDDQVEYAFETSALAGGTMLEWLKDEMHLVTDMKELDEMAASVKTTGGVTMVPAFAGLAAPDWDPTARGLMIGLNRGTKRAHLCRASLEAIACQTARLAKLIDEQTKIKSLQWMVSGGITNSAPLLQSQADISAVKICRAPLIESTAAGAAMMAGLGAGVWPAWKAAYSQLKCQATFSPKDTKRGQAYLAQYERALERAKGWA